MPDPCALTSFPHIAQRLFNTPLLVEPRKAQAIMGVLAPRLGIGRLRLPDGGELSAAEMRAGVSLEADRGMGRVFEMFDGVAYIPIEGTLVNKSGSLDPWSGMTGYDGLAVKLNAAMEDPAVRGILFDIDSPGGEVAGLFDLVDQVFESRQSNGGKPIWAVASDLAASAAYALASAADLLFLPSTGQVGSIGVVTMHVDFSKALEEEGLTVTLIFAGAHKVDGHPFAPLPEAVRADIQAEIDMVYSVLAETVGRNRPQLGEAGARATEARIFLGEGAIAGGLADGVASFREVFATMAAELKDRPIESAAPAA
jgi:ClpP class serine protease